MYGEAGKGGERGEWGHLSTVSGPYIQLWGLGAPAGPLRMVCAPAPNKTAAPAFP